MKFLPGREALESVVQPETFDDEIEVRGLPSDVLEGLFRGSAAARADWMPNLKISADLASGAESANVGAPAGGHGAASIELDLPDGLATLHSGAQGTVAVRPGHTLADTLLPQSLYLLLAQQWARAGLLLVHGAAFEFEGKGVLALGGKGTGKSVLTVAAMAAGAFIVSDDWLMIGVDSTGRLRAERLREFLMLRHGQVCDQLTSRMADLKPAPLASRPKTVFHFRNQADSLRRKCVPACNIEQIWLLKRPPSGRFKPSTREPASTAQALTALIRATMPILFSRRLATEASRLRQTANAAFARKLIVAVSTGPDLVEQPAEILSDLT